jgi:cadmium resistance protein CadD (predicted permease)
MVPLIIVVFMSWTVFWIDPVKIEAQLAVAATAMLTVIAYQFTLSNMLPKISYFTQLDYFVVGSNVLVFLALIEAVISSAIAREKGEKLARKFDQYSRYIFPLFYIIVLLVTFFT